jgi:hypothetical protein
MNIEMSFVRSLCQNKFIVVVIIIIIIIIIIINTARGMRLRSWLRHYATSRKVADSNPIRWMSVFNLPNLSSRSRSWNLLSLQHKSTSGGEKMCQEQGAAGA